MSAAHQADEQSSAAPLCVDLDGTLIHADVFIEGLLRLVFQSPWRIPEIVAWFTRGRAYAKARVAEASPFDAALLPYDERVLAFLREERAKGRTLVLASAADRRAVEAVAEHLGLFDAVIASDGAINVKAGAKADRLAAAYPNGFAYAGNESADIAVWRRARGAIVANCAPSVRAQAASICAIEREFPPAGGSLLALVKAMRPQQWSKNLLVFLPLLVGQGWSQPQAWAYAFMAFWALSCTASAVYLVNDAADIDADRRHPRKRNRPFASGALSPAAGLIAAFVFLVIGLYIAAAANVLGLALAYLAITTLYTFWVKRVVLIDVFVLASLYTVRIILGGVASGYFPSDWLLAFSCFFFLSLALVKRVAETNDVAGRGGGDVARRGYRAMDSNVLTTMGVSAGYIASLVLALYLQDDAVASRYREPFLLWGLPAVGILWTCRIWLKATRGEMHDDPIVFAAHDPWSWAMAAAAGLCFLAAATLELDIFPGANDSLNGR
jgi:4-hydroxybenzoate polyprenyltransferase